MINTVEIIDGKQKRKEKIRSLLDRILADFHVNILDTRYDLFIYGIKTPRRGLTAANKYYNLSTQEYLSTVIEYNDEIALVEIFMITTVEIIDGKRKRIEKIRSLLDKISVCSEV